MVFNYTYQMIVLIIYFFQVECIARSIIIINFEKKKRIP